MTSAYLFEDARGAEAAYAVIADEGELDDTAVLDVDVRDLGAAAELTVLRHDDTGAYGVPYTELELEILHGRLVLAVSTPAFGAEGEAVAGPPDVARDAVDVVETLGERLVARAGAALDGEAARLGSAVVRIESEVALPSFMSYQLLDGDPLQVRRGEHDRRQVDRLAAALEGLGPCRGRERPADPAEHQGQHESHDDRHLGATHVGLRSVRRTRLASAKGGTHPVAHIIPAGVTLSNVWGGVQARRRRDLPGQDDLTRPVDHHGSAPTIPDRRRPARAPCSCRT